MSNTVLSHSAAPGPYTARGVKVTVVIVLAVWLALVFIIGAGGGFVAPSGTPPLPIAAGFAVPLVLFFLALLASPAFHDFVRTADVRLMLAMQAWRFGGLAFIALETYRILPGGFAWPAGLGDIAIGLTAPLVLAAVNRRPRFVATPTFVVWNLLGILDLLVAVGSGTLISLLATGAAGEITTTPMSELPLVLIPVYLVPLFIMMHVSALMQARRLAGGSQ